MYETHNMLQAEFAYDSHLDVEFLNELYEGDKEHALAIFEQFLRNVHGQLKEVEDNFNSRDIESMRQKIHKMKPSFSFVGLSHLTLKAGQVENECDRNMATGRLVELYNDFKKSIIEYIPIIEKQLVKLKE